MGGKTVVTEQKDIQNIPHAARCRIDELSVILIHG